MEPRKLVAGGRGCQGIRRQHRRRVETGGGSAGVIEQGEYARESQEPGRPQRRRRRSVRPSEGNGAKPEVVGESERLSRSCEVGEPTRGTQRSKGRRRGKRARARPGGRDADLTNHPQARSDSEATPWSPGWYGAMRMPRTETKPQHEEPDALVAHVRICGGPAGRPAGLPDFLLLLE